MSEEKKLECGDGGGRIIPLIANYKINKYSYCNSKKRDLDLYFLFFPARITTFFCFLGKGLARNTCSAHVGLCFLVLVREGRTER